MKSKLHLKIRMVFVFILLISNLSNLLCEKSTILHSKGKASSKIKRSKKTKRKAKKKSKKRRRRTTKRKRPVTKIVRPSNLSVSTTQATTAVAKLKEQKEIIREIERPLEQQKIMETEKVKEDVASKMAEEEKKEQVGLREEPRLKAEKEAATKIQATYSGKLARTELRKLKEKKEITLRKQVQEETKEELEKKQKEAITRRLLERIEEQEREEKKALEEAEKKAMEELDKYPVAKKEFEQFSKLANDIFLGKASQFGQDLVINDISNLIQVDYEVNIDANKKFVRVQVLPAYRPSGLDIPNEDYLTVYFAIKDSIAFLGAILADDYNNRKLMIENLNNQNLMDALLIKWPASYGNWNFYPQIHKTLDGIEKEFFKGKINLFTTQLWKNIDFISASAGASRSGPSNEPELYRRSFEGVMGALDNFLASNRDAVIVFLDCRPENYQWNSYFIVKKNNKITIFFMDSLPRRQINIRVESRPEYPLVFQLLEREKQLKEKEATMAQEKLAEEERIEWMKKGYKAKIFEKLAQAAQIQWPAGFDIAVKNAYQEGVLSLEIGDQKIDLKDKKNEQMKNLFLLYLHVKIPFEEFKSLGTKRRMSLKWHSDKHPGAEDLAGEIFTIINDRFEYEM